MIAVARLCSDTPWVRRACCSSPRCKLLRRAHDFAQGYTGHTERTARTMAVRAQQRRYGERRTTRRPSTAFPPTADSLRVAAHRRRPGSPQRYLFKLKFTAHLGVHQKTNQI